MKIYKVSVDERHEEKYFADEQKAIAYGLMRLDESIHTEWARRDFYEWYEVNSWDEAKLLALDDGEGGVRVTEIEVIE